MRPPECEVCGGETDPATNSLVRFASADASRPWQARSDEAMVGHPADAGWFCSRHRDEALALTTATLAEAVAEMRRREPTPARSLPRSETEREPRRFVVPELRHVDIPGIEVSVLFELFVEIAPDVLAALGVVEVPALSRSQRRTWTPMDGAYPPDCPFTDVVEVAGANDAVKVRIHLERSQWNELEVSNASVSIGAWAIDGGHLGSVSTHTRKTAGLQAVASRLHIGEPFGPERLAALDRGVEAVRAVDRKKRRGG